MFACTLEVFPSASPFPLQRWAITNPDKESLLSVACIFAGYHAVKREFTPLAAACPLGESTPFILNSTQLTAAAQIFY